MSGTISIEQDTAYPAGHAVIRVPGAAGFNGPFGYRLWRDEFDEGNFGPQGWQVADALLNPEEHSTDGADLLLHIGPPVVQHVVSGVYHFALPAAGIQTVVFWPDLPLLSAAALNMIAEPARAAQTATGVVRPQIQRHGPEQPPPQAEPSVRITLPTDNAKDDDATAVQPPPVDKTTIVPQPRALWPRWALPLAILLLVIAAGGGYFAWSYWHTPEPVVAGRQGSPPAGGPPRPTLPQQAAGGSGRSAPSDLDIQHMTGIDLARSHLPPDVLLREAERRMQLGGAQRNDALLLMQVAADRGYAPAHAALGRFYDPNLPHAADVHPDEHEAALQYRAAIDGGDTSVAAARTTLKSYLEQRAQHGDVFAPQILKDYWQ